MADLARAPYIQDTIRHHLGTPGANLMSVPEIESETDLPLVARKLQIQVFALTDALSDVVEVLDDAIKRIEELESRLG